MIKLSKFIKERRVGDGKQKIAYYSDPLVCPSVGHPFRAECSLFLRIGSYSGDFMASTERKSLEIYCFIIAFDNDPFGNRNLLVS